MTEHQPPFRIRGLGEIAIRCDDIDAMFDFYRDILGLEVLSDTRTEAGIVFFKIADGFKGHTTVLALFRSDAGLPALHPHSTETPAAGGRSSLHHIALDLPFAEQEAAMEWYIKNDIDYQVHIFDWIGWRGVFVEDPEGNTVELVAFDAGLLGD